MAKNIDWSIHIDSSGIERKIENLINDDVMISIHNLFAEMCNPYVPMDEGPLSQNIEVTPNYVRYAEPYAHYQYMGEVYGPNFPGWEDGTTPGWRSPKDGKHPTGRELGKQGHAVLTPKWELKDGKYKSADPTKLIEWDFGYNREHHQKASHHWDKVMMSEKRDVFLKGVQDILTRRAKELYG